MKISAREKTGRAVTGRARRLMLSLMLAASMTFAAAGATASAAYGAVYPSDMVGTVTAGTNSTVMAAAPDVQADACALMSSDGKVLWRRNPDAQVPMASTTKIMTALLAIESVTGKTVSGDSVGDGNASDDAASAPGSQDAASVDLTDARFDNQTVVSENAASQEGSNAGLRKGDVVTLRDLLYGMMLPSGNDAAMATAEYLGWGDVNGFVAQMNARAAELGMESTQYSSPNGLVDDGNYSTASDYLKLVSTAMANSVFRAVVATPEYTYTPSNRSDSITIETTDELLGTYDGANGVKTGFTDAAGYCFVGSAERNGVELYAVVFGSPTKSSRFDDARALLDWGFSHYHQVTLATAGTKVGDAVATSWLDKTVPVGVAEDVSALLFDYDPDLQQTVQIEDRGGNIDAGMRMGIMTWSRDDQEIAKVDLVALEPLAAPGFFESIQIGWYRFASFFTGDNVSVEQVVTAGSTFPLIGATL